MAEIVTIFHQDLARAALDLALRGELGIICVAEFPPGAPRTNEKGTHALFAVSGPKSVIAQLDGIALARSPFGMTLGMRNALIAIEDHIRDFGVPPTLRELAERLGTQSTSNVKRLLDLLEERRWIRRLPYRARAIEVLRPAPRPEGRPS